MIIVPQWEKFPNEFCFPSSSVSQWVMFSNEECYEMRSVPPLLVYSPAMSGVSQRVVFAIEYSGPY